MLQAHLIVIPPKLYRDGCVLDISGVELAIDQTDRDGCKFLESVQMRQPPLAAFLRACALRSRTPDSSLGYITVTHDGLIYIPAPSPLPTVLVTYSDHKLALVHKLIFQEIWRG